MCGIMVCVAAALLGTAAGWQPLPDGGMQYIIQIEPGTLQSLKGGSEVESDVPPEVRDIRTCRIVVGNGELPRKLPAKATGPAAPADATQQAAAPPNASSSSPAAKAPAEPPAVLTGSTNQSGNAEAKPSADDQPSAAPARPWLPLSLALVVLFASLGGNIFLGWIALEVRARYRALVAQGAAPTTERTDVER
ncbi:MAG: hypothetical protein ABSG68_02330 [Thermoguttaceae bacterium]|jgi:hypothetical protein